MKFNKDEEKEIESENDQQVKEFKPKKKAEPKTNVIVPKSSISLESTNKLCLWVQAEAQKKKRAPRIAAQYGAALSFFLTEVDGLSKLKELK